MKKLNLIIVIAVLIWAVPVYAQDTVGNRTIAAEKYIDSIDLNKMINGMIAQVAKTLPKDKSQFFVKKAKAGIDTQGLRSVLIDTLVQVFNLEELVLMAEFYGSPTGKSIASKFPKYMGVAMPLIGAELKRAVRRN